MTQDFNERVILGVSSNFMFKEALARYEFALKRIKPTDKVLDLGSGTGYGSNLLASKAASVTGTDIDKEAVNYAKKHYKKSNLEFKQGDSTRMGFSEKFDVICSFEVIEHLKNPITFLENVIKHLKPDGIFMLSTPNIDFTSSERNRSPYHEKEYTLKEFSVLLRQVFRSVEIYGQTKSNKAQKAWIDFLNSQVVRQSMVDKDRFGLRKIVPRGLKEKVWKVMGNFAGRKTQEGLLTKDFPISLETAKTAHYFIAICQKSR